VPLEVAPLRARSARLQRARERVGCLVRPRAGTHAAEAALCSCPRWLRWSAKVSPGRSRAARAISGHLVQAAVEIAPARAAVTRAYSRDVPFDP